MIQNHLVLLLAVAAILFSQGIPMDAKLYDYKLCVSHTGFESILEIRCAGQPLERRSKSHYDVVRSAKQANTFLATRLFRRGYGQHEAELTDYREECCHEGCSIEEIDEYCTIAT